MWVLPNCKCVLKLGSLSEIQLWANLAQWPWFYSFYPGLDKYPNDTCYQDMSLSLSAWRQRVSLATLFLSFSGPGGSMEMFTYMAPTLRFGDYDLLPTTLCFWIFLILKGMYIGTITNPLCQIIGIAWVLNLISLNERVIPCFIVMTLVLLSKSEKQSTAWSYF